MTTIALLRGINVGGARTVPMADLRAGLERAGFADPRTLVQTGNVVLDAPAEPATADRVRAVLSDGFGLDDVPVVLRSARDLERVIAANPFPEVAADTPVMLHVFFLDAPPVADAKIDPDRSPRDRFHLAGQDLYVHYADGAGRSRLNLAYLEKVLGTSGTARNWNTIVKLAALAGSAQE